MNTTATSDATDARLFMILHGPVLPTLAKLTLPVIAVIAAQTFVAILEAYWVSRLGTDAVAGVSLVLPVFVLMGTMSNGGIGGGVSAAVSRALGAGRRDDANALVWHAIIVALAFGALFTGLAVLGGRSLYGAMGGTGAVLDNALRYSDWVFGGACLIWVVNLLGSAMRGAGEVRLPALVSLAGAALLIPLSPALIFGFGPVPALGVAGAGLATLIFYGGALVIYLRYLTSGKGALTLNRSGFEARLLKAILGVGLISAAGTLIASLTAVALTGTVGLVGSAAVAGYGIASRVDSLLVPLLFGLGSGVVTMVGVATGAGDVARARQVAWRAAMFAFIATQLIGIVVGVRPDLWMSLFTGEPAVLAVGSSYLRIAGPFYGFVGAGLLLYFASQGFSRMFWPFIAGAVRLAVTAGGAFWLQTLGLPLEQVFWAVALGTVIFGVINAFGFYRVS